MSPENAMQDRFDQFDDMIRSARNDERDAIAAEVRRYAAFYRQGSDGRNTFIMLAEWIDGRP